MLVYVADLCEEGEISSVDEVVFNHNDNNNINNPTEIKWSFDVNLNNNQVKEKIYVEKPLMSYSFDLGINSYKSIEKISMEKSLMPYSFDLGINTINNNSYKSTEKFLSKKISSCLGGPIHNLIASTTIFKNNPQMTLAELAHKCDTLTLSKLMNKTNVEDYREEITKKFFKDGYDDLEKSLKPWILDLEKKPLFS
nr:3757_t:CDS:2 [Entrophospora candida]